MFVVLLLAYSCDNSGYLENVKRHREEAISEGTLVIASGVVETTDCTPPTTWGGKYTYAVKFNDKAPLFFTEKGGCPSVMLEAGKNCRFEYDLVGSYSRIHPNTASCD